MSRSYSACVAATLRYAGCCCIGVFELVFPLLSDLKCILWFISPLFLALAACAHALQGISMCSFTSPAHHTCDRSASLRACNAMSTEVLSLLILAPLLCTCLRFLMCCRRTAHKKFREIIHTELPPQPAILEFLLKNVSSPHLTCSYSPPLGLHFVYLDVTALPDT